MPIHGLELWRWAFRFRYRNLTTVRNFFFSEHARTVRERFLSVVTLYLKSVKCILYAALARLHPYPAFVLLAS